MSVTIEYFTDAVIGGGNYNRAIEIYLKTTVFKRA